MTLGAYGMTLVPPVSPVSLVPVGDRWPAVELIREQGSVASDRDFVDEQRAELCLGGTSHLTMVAEERRAVFTTPEPISDAELVHPFLAPVAATFAWWWGRESFHAGAFAIDDGVWALLGAKESGKSSTLAALALAGQDVVCDDLLVVHAGMALAGPRCLDLRPAAASRLGVGERIQRGSQERWRLALGAITPALPLAGCIVLEWGDKVEALPVSGSDRLPRLAAYRSLPLPVRNPSALLELAVLPAWRLRRPSQWEALPQCIEAVLDITTRV